MSGQPGGIGEITMNPIASSLIAAATAPSFRAPTGRRRASSGFEKRLHRPFNVHTGTSTMQRIPFGGVDPSARHVERLIRRARIVRSDFVRYSLRRVFKAIGQTAGLRLRGLSDRGCRIKSSSTA